MKSLSDQAPSESSATWDFVPRAAGEAGSALKATPWKHTPVGDPNGWPAALKTLASVMLGSNHPMFIAWGPERTLLYNSAYCAILADKHPWAMGQDLLEVWSEVRDDLLPIVTEASAGRPVQMDEMALKMRRNGRVAEAHFSFSYTPIPDEQGQIVGFFCACQETTSQVLAERRATLEREQQRRLLRQFRCHVSWQGASIRLCQ